MEVPRAKSKLNLNHGSGEADRLVAATRIDDDQAFELKLRPTRLAEFIGQTKAKEQLAILAKLCPGGCEEREDLQKAISAKSASN